MESELDSDSKAVEIIDESEACIDTNAEPKIDIADNEHTDLKASDSQTSSPKNDGSGIVKTPISGLPVKICGLSLAPSCTKRDADEGKGIDEKVAALTRAEKRSAMLKMSVEIKEMKKTPVSRRGFDKDKLEKKKLVKGQIEKEEQLIPDKTSPSPSPSPSPIPSPRTDNNTSRSRSSSPIKNSFKTSEAASFFQTDEKFRQKEVPGSSAETSCDRGALNFNFLYSSPTPGSSSTPSNFDMSPVGSNDQAEKGCILSLSSFSFIKTPLGGEKSTSTENLDHDVLVSEDDNNVLMSLPVITAVLESDKDGDKTESSMINS